MENIHLSIPVSASITMKPFISSASSAYLCCLLTNFHAFHHRHQHTPCSLLSNFHTFLHRYRRSSASAIILQWSVTIVSTLRPATSPICHPVIGIIGCRQSSYWFDTTFSWLPISSSWSSWLVPKTVSTGGVKDGQVSQQLKQWVHRCPPPRLKKRERRERKK